MGCLNHWRGRELEIIAIILWQHSLTSLVILICLNLMSQGGKGVTFLLHGVNIMDSVVWSFLYMQIPFTVHEISSMSTVSISKFVLIDPKRKSQMGLISHVISVMITFIFKPSLFENLLMLT